MGLSKLSEKCRQCPFVGKCDHKEMESLAYLEPAVSPAVAELTEPLRLPHDYRNIKIAENTTVMIDLEELKKQLVASHFPLIGLNYGA